MFIIILHCPRFCVYISILTPIFGTTNKRKIRDLLDIIKNNQLDLEVLTLEDIGWDLGEIEETG